jgi:hypothetical protein
MRAPARDYPNLAGKSVARPGTLPFASLRAGCVRPYTNTFHRTCAGGARLVYEFRLFLQVDVLYVFDA